MDGPILIPNIRYRRGTGTSHEVDVFLRAPGRKRRNLTKDVIFWPF